MPINSNSTCQDNSAGACCNIDNDGQAWAACAIKFAYNRKEAYCVDSRGFKGTICSSQCSPSITVCPEKLLSCD